MKKPYYLYHTAPGSSGKDKPTQTTPIPGLHIIANLSVADADQLCTFAAFRAFIDKQIARHKLCSVGEVYHNFDNGGYTAVICLTESHLSIHTWPENHYLTFDVFLSNHLKDNRATTILLYEAVKEHFKATVLFEQIISR